MKSGIVFKINCLLQSISASTQAQFARKQGKVASLISAPASGPSRRQVRAAGARRAPVFSQLLPTQKTRSGVPVTFDGMCRLAIAGLRCREGGGARLK